MAEHAIRFLLLLLSSCVCAHRPLSYQVQNKLSTGPTNNAASPAFAAHQNMAVQSENPHFTQIGGNSIGAPVSGSETGAPTSSALNCDGPPPPCEPADSRDFNPALLGGGVRGQPGIKARLNPSAFDYLSQQLVGILNYQVKRLQIPQISQCLPNVGGCLKVNNIRVSNYRCTRQVSLHTAPPNHLVLDVQNVDVSVSGNLGGQITLMVPLALYGLVHVNAQRLSVKVGVVVESVAPAPALRMVSCSARVGSLQMSIEQGGLLGDIAQQNLHDKLTKIVRKQISGQLCKRLPELIDQQINSKIGSIVPSKIGVNQMLEMLKKVPCVAKLISGGGDQSTVASFAGLKKKRHLPAERVPCDSKRAFKRQLEAAADQEERVTANAETTTSSSSVDETTTAGGPKPSLSSIVLGLFDMKKLNNIYLNAQLMDTSADAAGYTLGIRGGFSVCGWGCTPFAPVPMTIPPCYGANCKMVEAMVSEFAVNSLLYHLHKVGFFVFHVGPNTPEIGRLMRLECEGSSSADEGTTLEDHGVEAEDGTLIKGFRRVAKGRRSKRQDDGGDESGGGGGIDINSIVELGFCMRSLLPGPASTYEGKDERVDVELRTERAPSVRIYGNGTVSIEFVAVIDFFAHSNKQKLTTFRAVGQINLNVQQEEGKISANMEIASLKVTDTGGKSGLDQDTLDSFVSLLQDQLLGVVNEQLAKGCKVDLSSGAAGLPIGIIDPEVAFVDHAVHLKTNFRLLDTSALGASEPCLD